MTVVTAWIIASLLCVATVALLAVVLVRKAIGLMIATSQLLGRAAILDGVHREEAGPRAAPAVLGGLAAASRRWGAARHRSQRLRAERRAARLIRGNALLTVDPASIRRYQR